jgi:soluble lytic murein transglycosylase-like protein
VIPAEAAALVRNVARYDALVMAASLRYGVPSVLLKALIAVESAGNERAFNPETGSTGGPSRGLMQIQEATARGLGFSGPWERLFDPVVNIDLGARLVRQLWDQFKGNLADIVAAYNGGPRVVAQRVPGAPYRNQAYVDRVVSVVAAVAGAPLVVGPVALLVVLLMWWWRSRGKRRG